MTDALSYVLDWLDSNSDLDPEVRATLRARAERIDARDEASRAKVALPGGPPGQHAWIEGDAVRLELWFPRSLGSQRRVQVDLVDAVDTDPLSLRYCYERSGWVVEQASCFEFDFDTPVAERDPDFQEVAFVRSWARRDGQDAAASDPSRSR